MVLAGILFLTLSLIFPHSTLASDYVDNSDGTVTDKSSGLVWQQPHEHELRTWEQAVNYCDELTLGNNSNWRLPEVKELETLLDKNRFAPTINRQYFSDTLSAFFWTASTDKDQTDQAWIVGFNGGHVISEHKGLKNYVRCVR